MPIAPDIITAGTGRAVRAQYLVHDHKQILRGNPRAKRDQRSLGGIIKTAMRQLCRLARRANRKIAVEVTEITIPYAASVQHQDIAICQRAVVWRGNDIAVAARTSRADQIADIIDSALQRITLEFAEQLIKRQAGLHPVRNGGKGIIGKAADMPDLFNFTRRLHHADGLDVSGYVGPADPVQHRAQCHYICQRCAE